MPRFKNVFIAQIIGVGLISVYLSGSASAQAPVYFTLATTGCSKKHCSQTEGDAVNLGTPSPASISHPLGLYTPNSGPNPIGDPDHNSEGCSSNGTIVACKSHTPPFLKVFGQNGDMIYNSCGGTDATNPTGCLTLTTPDRFSKHVSTALIGTDNSVIAADDHGIARYYCSTGAPGCTISLGYRSFSTVTALMSLSLEIPQGTIYTPAPDGLGGVKGLVTLLFQNGPVATFDPGSVGVNPSYIGMDAIDQGTSCVDMGTCFYAGTNSACAVTLHDGDDNVTGGRIYDVVNQDLAIGMTPSEAEQYQGRLYALTITTSGITQNWD